MVTKLVEVETVKMATLEEEESIPEAKPRDPLTCSVKWISYMPKGESIYIIVVFGELTDNTFTPYTFEETIGNRKLIWAWGCEYTVKTPEPKTETTTNCPTYALDFRKIITPDALVILTSYPAWYKQVDLGKGKRVVGVLYEAYENGEELLDDYWLKKAMDKAYDMEVFKNVVKVYSTAKITGFEVKIG